MQPQILYLIWFDEKGGAHISRDDGRVDQYTGNSLTPGEAVKKLSKSKLNYKLIEERVGGERR